MTIFRCIDFETTGIPSEAEPHAVVEYGRCDVHHERPAVVGETVSALCNPGRPIPVEARAVHHIGDADVVGCISPDQAFRDLMAGNPAYFVAHNADYERQFFGGREVPWICTYKVALRLWPDAPSHSLQVLRYFLDLPVENARAMPPHRAGPDAYLCAVLMARILDEGRVSADEMVRWSNGPALMPRIPFGKHRGKRWEEVPLDYLDWVANKSELDRDAKANARHWIKRQTGAPA